VVTTSPDQSVRITSTASSSMSSRSSVSGQEPPTTCSLSASPLPTPRTKRLSWRSALVAAAWAMTAGCVRIMGQVTAVVTGSRHTWESAPITDQTNGLSPCSSFQGWKWSEIHSASNPASSAIRAWSSSSPGVNSSLDRK
jgi:hypothetical protein